MAHYFPTYDAYYKSYGLTKADDGTYLHILNRLANGDRYGISNS